MEDPTSHRSASRADAETEAPERRGAEGVLFDLARKGVVGSVRSILSSEDGIRALIGAIVPKEVGQAVLREIATLRTETVHAVVEEVGRFLERLDPAVEVQKVLSGLRFDVHVRVEVSPREGPSAGTVPPATEDRGGGEGRKPPHRRGGGRGRAP